MDWTPHADRLASEVAHPVSRWRPVIAAIPRHVFVPRWWSWSAAGPGFGSDIWELRDGSTDEDGWARAAYRDRSLVTQVGPLHADRAERGDRPAGMPTSSATLPGLIVQMLRHAHVCDGVDVGTGSGYGCAVLAQRLGDQHVTSVDVDAYLTKAAAERSPTRRAAVGRALHSAGAWYDQRGAVAPTMNVCSVAMGAFSLSDRGGDHGRAVVAGNVVPGSVAVQ